MTRKRWLLLFSGLGLLGLLTFGIAFVLFGDIRSWSEYQDPVSDEWMTDDSLASKKAPAFNATLVSKRLLDGWQVNLSAVQFGLDILPAKPDEEPEFANLYPSFAAAREADLSWSLPFLPSVNMLDGKCKQFDDGLYAALEQAYYQGIQGKLESHVRLVQRLYERVGPASEAAPFLAAGLELAGVQVPVSNPQAKQKFLRQFNESAYDSRPIGFYTWYPALQNCYRFLRFFQREFGQAPPYDHRLNIPFLLHRALANDAALMNDYRRMLRFFAGLTNPLRCLSVADLESWSKPSLPELQRLARERKKPHEAVALFPASTTREGELFERLFDYGVPQNVDLMRTLIQRIRSGEVDLAVRPNSGWMEYQVHALETLLLPGRGEEANKLLLSGRYKKRMLEAFQALLTKRHELHFRQTGGPKATGSTGPRLPPKTVRPLLRVEPCPTFYVRTARAYDFLSNFLKSQLGEDTLQSLYGLKEDGRRAMNLRDELQFMRELFYGLYLVSCDDLGMMPKFLAGESVERERCYDVAMQWLKQPLTDPDMAVDVRMTVPMFWDPVKSHTHLWGTFGVRLAKLEVRFVGDGRPHLRSDPTAAWNPADRSTIKPIVYLLPVEEFGTFALVGNRVLTRAEIRTICDREKTKAAIMQSITN